MLWTHQPVKRMAERLTRRLTRANDVLIGWERHLITLETFEQLKCSSNRYGEILSKASWWCQSISNPISKLKYDIDFSIRITSSTYSWKIHSRESLFIIEENNIFPSLVHIVRQQWTSCSNRGKEEEGKCILTTPQARWKGRKSKVFHSFIGSPVETHVCTCYTDWYVFLNLFFFGIRIPFLVILKNT